MTTPQISVILSVYNQADYLPQAIASILGQSLTNFEFIIVNDGSTDSTSKQLNSLKDPRIKLVNHQARQGLAQSLNQAISQSRGEYIARMDADDIAHENRLKIQLGFLSRHPQIAACGTAVNLINSRGEKIGQKRYPTTITRSTLFRYNPLIHPSAMMRRSALPSPPYNPDLNGAEDYYLWFYLASQHKLANLNQVLLDYRINPQGISWGSLKYTELQAIKVRLKALMHYNNPLWYAIFITKPALSYLIPVWIKKLLFNIR